VRLPIRDMGRLAAAKLLPSTSRDEADKAGMSLVVPHLIVRDSSRPPPR
jgi:DNA-binding LacI/PurR family transcriptional regulator